MKVSWVIAVLLAFSPVISVSSYLSSDYRIWSCGFDIETGQHRCVVVDLSEQYIGQVSFHVSGAYHHVSVDTKGTLDTVFVLTAGDGRLFRLVFYCRSGNLVTMKDRSVGVIGGYEFCKDVPLQDYQYISVLGTLITPSQWDPALSTPHLIFDGDLYVFEIS